MSENRYLRANREIACRSLISDINLIFHFFDVEWCVPISLIMLLREAIGHITIAAIKDDHIQATQLFGYIINWKKKLNSLKTTEKC
jgi:hypothetical protein